MSTTPEINLLERLTPRAKTIIENAAEAAEMYGHDYIGTDHLLIGILRSDQGVASEMLQKAKVSEREVARECGWLSEESQSTEDEWNEYLRLSRKFRMWAMGTSKENPFPQPYSVTERIDRIQKSQSWDCARLASELGCSVSTLHRAKRENSFTPKVRSGVSRLECKLFMNLDPEADSASENDQGDGRREPAPPRQ